jgi:hypothetical protein
VGFVVAPNVWMVGANRMAQWRSACHVWGEGCHRGREEVEETIPGVAHHYQVAEVEECCLRLSLLLLSPQANATTSTNTTVPNTYTPIKVLTTTFKLW